MLAQFSWSQEMSDKNIFQNVPLFPLLSLLSRAKREANKQSLIHQLPRLKREASTQSPVDHYLASLDVIGKRD